MKANFTKQFEEVFINFLLKRIKVKIFTKVRDAFTFNVWKILQGEISEGGRGSYFNSSKGTIFKETNGKEELIGPRDFVIILSLRINAYQSFYHFMFWRYDKISVNSGHQEARKYSILPFPFVHSWFFICSTIVEIIETKFHDRH